MIDNYRSIQKLIQVIKMAIRWRAEECDLPIKPFPFSVKDMFPKRWEVKRDRRLEKSEYIKLMSHVRAIKAPSSRFWRYLIRLAIETAARQQELIYAEWREVDMDRKIWFIPASHTKCQTARAVPLSRAAFRILSMLKLMASPDDTRIFHGLSNPSVVCAMFRKFTRKLNLKDLRFHDLRHEAISRMVIYKRQLSVFEIMTMVGHSSMEMLRRYTNLRTDELVGRMD